MKTLDEVIETAPYVGTEWTNDALHYLNEYRDAKDALEAERERYQEAVKNCERVENVYLKKQKAACDIIWKMSSEENLPLTWEELKQMDGKPVYLEQYWLPMEDEFGATEDEIEIDKYWAVIDNVQPKRIHFIGKKLVLGLAKDDLCPSKNGGWQAYRKER